MSRRNKTKEAVESQELVELGSAILNSSLNSSNENSKSSTVRKRSLYSSDLEIYAQGQQNDDHEEKVRRRSVAAAVASRVEEKMEIQPSSEQTSSSTLIHQLTPEELEDHYFHCISLFSKNKVTTKNAFKLQLIDCMKKMIDEKNEKANNLLLMSRTLDASVKIYSCRVDRVYSDMKKYISGTSTRENEDEESEEVSKKPKRSKRKTDCDEDESDDELSESKDDWPNEYRFIAKPESLVRKDFGQVSYCENKPKNQQYFMEFPISSSGCELLMEQPLVDETPPSFSFDSSAVIDLGNFYSGGVDVDNLAQYIPGYDDLNNKFFVVDEDLEKSQVVDNLFTYDPKALKIAAESVEQIPNDVSDEDMRLDDTGYHRAMVADYDEDEDISACASSTFSSSRLTGKPTVSLVPTGLTKFLPLVSTEEEQVTRKAGISMFDESKLQFMVGASHWKRYLTPQSGRFKEITKKATVQQSKRKVLNIDYQPDSVDYHWKLLVDEDNNAAKTLTVKTITDWQLSKGKISWPKDISYSLKQLTSLFKREETFNMKELTSDIENCEGVEHSFSQHDLINSDGDVGDCYEINDDLAPLDDCDDAEETANNIETDNPSQNDDKDKAEISSADLVQPKFKLEKNTIQFAKIQKRIDIKLLKSTMWNVMGLENLGEENVEKENMGEIDNVVASNVLEKDGVKKQVNFSDTLEKLPSHLSESMSSDVSTATAFNTLLYLANEKVLKLENCGDNDVSIVQD